ncbi:MAG: methyl-accepting chemotaxis protein [Nodosilinea sp.]
MLNNLKLRTRIFLGYTPAVAVLLALTGTIYIKFQEELRILENLAQLEQMEVALGKTTLDVSGVVGDARGMVVFPDDLSYREDYLEEVKRYEENLAELTNLAEAGGKQAQLTAYLAETQKLLQDSEKVLQALQSGQPEQARQLVEAVRFPPTYEAHTAFEEQIKNDFNAASAKEKEIINFLLLLITVGSLVSILLMAIAGFVIASGISRSVQSATTEIATASNEIATTMEEQERVASAQAASVNETTTTMDELEASCRQSAEQAQAAVAAASQALALATRGTQAVGETIEGMFVMEKNVESIAEQIIRLSEQASQIAGIASLVSELANQTNMIALNSSVEAVRAGEAGKGFAVVANEIRKLSDHSQESADKINVLVADIQKAVNSSVMVIDEGTKIVKGNVEVAKHMEKSFSGVTESVNKVMLNNQQVSLNLKQQVEAIQEVVKAMDTINKGARETSAGLIQTRKGTEGLNEAASALNNMI